MEEPIEERFFVSLEELKTVFKDNNLIEIRWPFSFGHNHLVFYEFMRNDIEYTLSFTCDQFFCNYESGITILAKEGLRNVELVIDDLEKGTTHTYKLKQHGAGN